MNKLFGESKSRKMSYKENILYLDILTGGWYGLSHRDLDKMSENELKSLHEELKQVLIEQEAEAAAYNDHDY